MARPKGSKNKTKSVYSWMSEEELKKYQQEKRARESKRINEYVKRCKTSYTFKFNNETDKAVIEKLNSLKNKSNYLRHLILQDIEKNDK